MSTTAGPARADRARPAAPGRAPAGDGEGDPASGRGELRVLDAPVEIPVRSCCRVVQVVDVEDGQVPVDHRQAHRLRQPGGSCTPRNEPTATASPASMPSRACAYRCQISYEEWPSRRSTSGRCDPARTASRNGTARSGSETFGWGALPGAGPGRSRRSPRGPGAPDRDVRDPRVQDDVAVAEPGGLAEPQPGADQEQRQDVPGSGQVLEKASSRACARKCISLSGPAAACFPCRAAVRQGLRARHRRELDRARQAPVQVADRRGGERDAARPPVGGAEGPGLQPRRPVGDRVARVRAGDRVRHGRVEVVPAADRADVSGAAGLRLDGVGVGRADLAEPAGRRLLLSRQRLNNHPRATTPPSDGSVAAEAPDWVADAGRGSRT